MSVSIHWVRPRAFGLVGWVAVPLLVSAVAQAQPARSRRPVYAAPPNFEAAERELFFPNALEVVGPKPTRRTSRLAADPRPTRAAEQPLPALPMPGEASSTVSLEALETEIKAISASLAAATKSKPQFQARGFQDARRDLSMLAVCFERIAEGDEPSRFRSSAGPASAACAVAAAACREPSDSALTAARGASEMLTAFIRGDTVDWPREDRAAVEFAPLMQRLEIAEQQRLRPFTADAASVGARRDELAHEAEIVELLAERIAAPGYEFSGDEGYRRHAQELGAAAAALRQAGDPRSAQAAATRITASCDACHEDYRG